MSIRRRSAAPFARPRRSNPAPLAISAALISVALMARAPVAHAQTAAATHEQIGDLKKLSLEQLFDLEVVSVSQKPESLFKAAAAIHVVTASDLRQMGASSIPEALRNIPGVEVARVDSRQYAITARGFNGTVANKLLVLIDGRSVYTPLFSGVFWDVQDAFIDDIQQIEVIRGPGATVWGANAVNGVINVRTKPAGDTQGFLVYGGGGNANHDDVGARYGGTLGPHAFFRLYGKHFDRASSLRSDGSDAGDPFRMSQGGARIDWSPPGANEFTVQGDGYGGSADQPSSDAIDLKGGNALAQWRRRFSATADLDLHGYFDHTDRTIPATFGEALDTYDLELRHRFAFGLRHDVVWGLGYRLTHDDVRNSPGLAFLPPHQTRQLFSGFVQDEFAWTDRLRVTVGSKLEHNDYTGFEYQPSVRLAYAPAMTQTLWAAASRAVRTPSRIDRDLFVPASPPYFLAGGPDFTSEVLRAFELGYKVQAAHDLTASVATFYNLYDHLRSVELGPPAVLANGLHGRTDGIEVEAAYQVSRPWRVNAGYTFLELDLDRAAWSTDVTGKGQEGDSPRHQSFLRSSLALPHQLELDLTARYVGKLPNQQVPAYTTGEAHLSWQATAALELEIVGRNLMDPRHPEFGTPANRREVPRSIEGRAQWHW